MYLMIKTQEIPSLLEGLAGGLDTSTTAFYAMDPDSVPDSSQVHVKLVALVPGQDAEGDRDGTGVSLRAIEDGKGGYLLPHMQPTLSTDSDDGLIASALGCAEQGITSPSGLGITGGEIYLLHAGRIQRGSEDSGRVDLLLTIGLVGGSEPNISESGAPTVLVGLDHTAFGASDLELIAKLEPVVSKILAD